MCSHVDLASLSIPASGMNFSASVVPTSITNPRRCNGSWPFALTVTNWFGQPSITAHDQVKCHA